jgi:hypothetical protein
MSRRFVRILPRQAVNLGSTWLEGEELCYPSGGFKRRARVILRRNEHNPLVLPYGESRVVKCSIADTFFSIPARLSWRGQTVRGFVSVTDDRGMQVFTFTPEAAKGE